MMHHNIPVTLQIGKQGLTASVLAEIQKQLKTRKIIKIRLLKSALEDLDRKKFAEELAEKSNAYLVHQVGFIVVLKK